MVSVAAIALHPTNRHYISFVICFWLYFWQAVSMQLITIILVYVLICIL